MSQLIPDLLVGDLKSGAQISGKRSKFGGVVGTIRSNGSKLNLEFAFIEAGLLLLNHLLCSFQQ